MCSSELCLSVCASGRCAGPVCVTVELFAPHLPARAIISCSSRIVESMAMPLGRSRGAESSLAAAASRAAAASCSARCSAGASASSSMRPVASLTATMRRASRRAGPTPRCLARRSCAACAALAATSPVTRTSTPLRRSSTSARSRPCVSLRRMLAQHCSRDTFCCCPRNTLMRRVRRLSMCIPGGIRSSTRTGSKGVSARCSNRLPKKAGFSCARSSSSSHSSACPDSCTWRIALGTSQNSSTSRRRASALSPMRVRRYTCSSTNGGSCVRQSSRASSIG
mmetsp:Transcript_13959/g.44777  ORF Transcript_13959/g.44777 Transcript_13959/m.44777 type:complete len:281 (+) Transcript_13959:741-1583(+)